ncbi:MAG: nicotinate (nicotinamide) nucleotide adenylyltransferase [Clostridia bacterium]|nr:nicotinate (nicotinamide) nucleotide adenylyltransferase [Clostridia bacterium]
MKVGFLGGTFDPLHNGHLALAEDSLTSGGLDRLVVIPAGTTVHKPVDRVSGAGMRYWMCRLGFQGMDSVEVSRCEALRDHGSYTIDTIRELRRSLDPGDELHMVCGADILFDLLHWRFPQDIMRETAILASLRPGHDRTSFEARAAFLRDEYGARIRFFDARQVDVSSTGIRMAVASGDDISDRMPQNVARFVRDAGLYAPDNPLDTLTAEQTECLRHAERILLEIHDGPRLEHSLLTMTTAARLAARFGLDIYSAALAGLVHDCAKGLPRQQALSFVDPADHATAAEPKLHHGPAGAVLAKDLFGIGDRTVLDAIRYHITGRAGMTPVEMAVYIADKTEPSRRYPGVDAVRTRMLDNLEDAFLLSAGSFAAILSERGMKAHPDMLAAISELERRHPIDH